MRHNDRYNPPTAQRNALLLASCKHFTASLTEDSYRMSIPKSPFADSSVLSGHGEIILSLLTSKRQVLTKCTYQYPLKLISPDPHEANEIPVTVAFLLTYGGGLIGGDKINVKISLAQSTRLVLLTQGSTKIFKSPRRDVISGQTLNVHIGNRASLCYLPDPTQPFGESVFDQRQNFFIHPDSSLCMLDWVSEGRKARGESWDLWRWQGRNEIRDLETSRLILRDSVALDSIDHHTGLEEKTNHHGVLGTLILYGPVFAGLGDLIIAEFMSQPKIGNKSWKEDHEKTTAEREGELKQAMEKAEGLLWTAVRTRGCVLLKFGCRDVDGGRRWLRNLLKHEGTIERNFGHQALMCLR